MKIRIFSSSGCEIVNTSMEQCREFVEHELYQEVIRDMKRLTRAEKIVLGAYASKATRVDRWKNGWWIRIY